MSKRVNPYLNPDGSVNEKRLVEDILSYKGSNRILIAAAQAYREAIAAAPIPEKIPARLPEKMPTQKG